MTNSSSNIFTRLLTTIISTYYFKWLESHHFQKIWPFLVFSWAVSPSLSWFMLFLLPGFWESVFSHWQPLSSIPHTPSAGPRCHHGTHAGSEPLHTTPGPREPSSPLLIICDISNVSPPKSWPKKCRLALAWAGLYSYNLNKIITTHIYRDHYSFLTTYRDHHSSPKGVRAHLNIRISEMRKQIQKA